MGVSPASMGVITLICDVCSAQRRITPNDIFGGVDSLWLTAGYRGMPGVICNACADRIYVMPDTELKALITSTRVAVALTS